MRHFLCMLFVYFIILLQPAQAATEYTDTMNGVQVTVWQQSSKAAVLKNMPLIIFSHGFGGCSTQSSFLTDALATRGYLVIAPNHKDALCLNDSNNNDDNNKNNRKGGIFKRWRTASPSNDKTQKISTLPEVPFSNPSEWSDTTHRDRHDDVVKVLNFVLSNAPYNKMIDANRIGIIGHSLGGYTALGMAGAWPSWKDKRFKVALAFAPFCAPYVLKKAIGNITIPTMFQGGTEDMFTLPYLTNPDGAFNQAKGQKYLVIFDGANHSAWSNKTTDFQKIIAGYSIAFLDHYLRGFNTPLLFNNTVSGVAEYRSNMNK